MCLEKSSTELDYKYCRVTQAAFDTCMKEKLGMERPHFGYHALVKVHETKR
jgi:NADH dehydrogenase (ubiquinone) 1 alpha subcomplex subunit 8